MAEDRRGAKVGATILRRLLDRPGLTVDDVAAHAEVGEKCARSWLKAFEGEGLIRGKIGRKRRNYGCAPIEYAISSKWGEI